MTPNMYDIIGMINLIRILDILSKDQIRELSRHLMPSCNTKEHLQCYWFAAKYLKIN